MKDKSISSNSTLSSAAISMFLIGLTNHPWIGLDKNEASFLSMIIPIAIGFIVLLINWLFAKFGIKSAAQIKSECSMDKRIIFLKKEFKEASDLGRNTSEIDKELTKAILARSKLYELDGNQLSIMENEKSTEPAIDSV